MLNKEELNIIKEGWATNLLLKYKDKFKEFFLKLKHQFEYNAKAKHILLDYIQTGNLSVDDAKELKTMSVDLLKLVGLGSIALAPIPGGTLLMLFLINSAKHIGIDLIPSHFEAHHAGVEYGIKINEEDEDGDRFSVVLYNLKPTNQYLIGKVTIEKIFDGLDFMIIDEDEYYKYFPSNSYIKIESIQIQPFYAKSGFGKILMGLALEEINKRKGNFDRIYLNASPMGGRIPLKNLIVFYESFGFKIFHKEANNAEMYKEI